LAGKHLNCGNLKQVSLYLSLDSSLIIHAVL